MFVLFIPALVLLYKVSGIKQSVTILLYCKRLYLQYSCVSECQVSDDQCGNKIPGAVKDSVKTLFHLTVTKTKYTEDLCVN